jgi:anti-sigma regulatory factor (Ser/Thr protein kinase)
VRTTVREFVFEEVVINILRDDREHDITVSIDFFDSAIVMQFEDDGVPSDPSKHRPAAQPDSILDVQIGGRGLTLLRAAASHLEYRSDGGSPQPFHGDGRRE